MQLQIPGKGSPPVPTSQKHSGKEPRVQEGTGRGWQVGRSMEYQSSHD